MSDGPPPWARPRGPEADPPRINRRRSTGAGAAPAGTPPPRDGSTGTAPPAGRRPPPMPTRSGPSTGPSDEPGPPDRPDPHVGVLAGAVDTDRPEWTVASSPGLVAVAVAAALATGATLIGAALGRTGGAPVLAGSILPALVVAGCAAAQWLTFRTGSDAVLRFTVRTTVGRSERYEMRCDASRGTLRTGDLIRVVPGVRGPVRAVEVLATLSGPVMRRLDRRSALTPVQWAGFVAAVGLLVGAVVILAP